MQCADLVSLHEVGKIAPTKEGFAIWIPAIAATLLRGVFS